VATQLAAPAAIQARPRLRSLVDHELPFFFVMAFGISWAFWLASYLTGGPVGIALFLAGGFGPMAAAGYMTVRAGGSLSGWFRSIFRWRVAPRFYVYALGLPLLIWGVINLELALLGQPVDIGLLTARLAPALGAFLVVLTVGGGFEEPGWRGFALPRLQERFTPVRATLVLGVIWGLWHLPIYGLLAPLLITPLAFLYTYLYNKTGSVLLCVLLHASITPANDNLILTREQIHGVTDIVILATVVAAAVAITLLTHGKLGFHGTGP